MTAELFISPALLSVELRTRASYSKIRNSVTLLSVSALTIFEKLRESDCCTPTPRVAELGEGFSMSDPEYETPLSTLPEKLQGTYMYHTGRRSFISKEDVFPSGIDTRTTK